MTCFTKKPRSLLLKAALLEIKSCAFFERKVDSIASKWLHPQKTNIYQLSYPLCCAISLYLSSLEALQNNILHYTFRFALLGSHSPICKVDDPHGNYLERYGPLEAPIQIHQIGQRPQYQRPGNRKVPRYKKSKTKPLVNPQALKSLICGCGARLSMVPVISKVTGNHWVKRSLSVSISKSWRIGHRMQANSTFDKVHMVGALGAGFFRTEAGGNDKKDPGFFCMICMDFISLPY